MLDAAWGDTNTGTATGGTCGSNCKAYQVDHDAHWTATSPEYTWLQQDLAAHPGGLKLAFFHYPLYTSNATQVSDPYLDNLPGKLGQPRASCWRATAWAWRSTGTRTSTSGTSPRRAG